LSRSCRAALPPIWRRPATPTPGPPDPPGDVGAAGDPPPMMQGGRGSVSPMDPLSSTVSNPVATPSALVTWPGARVLMVLLGAEYS